MKASSEKIVSPGQNVLVAMNSRASKIEGSTFCFPAVAASGISSAPSSVLLVILRSSIVRAEEKDEVELVP